MSRILKANYLLPNTMYLVYSRKSTDDADNQKNSLEYQELECRKYAQTNNLQITTDDIGDTVEGGIIKERHSAFKGSKLSVVDARVEYQIERPKFMQMAHLLLDGKYEGVIVLCFDRISRNEQSDMIVKELIKVHGINIHFVYADYDLSTSSGELHMDIDGMFARHHSRVTSEKVKITFDKLRSEKKCTYFSPIGYLDKGSDCKEFDPERAPTIKRLFELYATGEWSLSELCKWSYGQGFTTKPRRRRRTHEEIMKGIEIEKPSSMPICTSTLQVILTNRFYVGEIRHKDKWMEGMHSPLIDVALFNKVTNKLSENCVTVHYVDKPFFTYRGLVKCSCGRAYSPYMKKGHIYYCSKCKEGCKNAMRNVKEELLVDQIQLLIEKIHFTDDELQQIEEGAKSGLKKAASKRDAEIQDLYQRKKRINEDLDYLKSHKITLLREGAMSPSEWKKDSENLIAEQKEVDALFGAHTETEEEMLEYVLTVSELAKNASRLYKLATSQEKRRLAHLVFSELVLVDGKMASYKAKEEFAPLLERPRDQVGSRGRIRTDDQFVNSELLYR